MNQGHFNNFLVDAMNHRYTFNIFSVFLIIILTHCSQKEELPATQGKVELYLLESFETTGDHYFQIDETSAITEASPLLEFKDLLSYHPNEHFFTISEEAKQKIENLDHSVHGLAFGIIVNDELIYTGYFWPSYSSLSCDWIVIDPVTLSKDNKLKVNLGYASSIPEIEVPDRRNDPRLLSVFRVNRRLMK
jgi:hypothetical protein